MNARTKMEEFQDEYRDNWVEQVKLDRKNNAQLREPITTRLDRKMHVENGKKGGAPRLQLTNQAEVFNRMILNGMSHEEIAFIMGVETKRVAYVVKRFKLPRTDV